MFFLVLRRRDRRAGSQFVRTGNISVTSPLKLTKDKVTVLQFTTDTTDTVGSLAVEVAILRTGGPSQGVSVSGNNQNIQFQLSMLLFHRKLERNSMSSLY